MLTMMVTNLNPPSIVEQDNELIRLWMSVWWWLLERWVIDFSPGSNQNAEKLIKVRKVVSLLSGLNDRSGNSGDMSQHTERVLVTTRTCTAGKMPLVWMCHRFTWRIISDGWNVWMGPKRHSNKWPQTSCLFSVMFRLKKLYTNDSHTSSYTVLHLQKHQNKHYRRRPSLKYSGSYCSRKLSVSLCGKSIPLSSHYPLPHIAWACCMGLWLKLGWWENGNVVIKTGPIWPPS